jgi:hypothetical protein
MLIREFVTKKKTKKNRLVLINETVFDLLFYNNIFLFVVEMIF